MVSSKTAATHAKENGHDRDRSGPAAAESKGVNMRVAGGGMRAQVWQRDM
jgi:hypothetical protein